MDTKQLTKQLQDTVKIYQELHKKAIENFEKSIKDVPSEEAKTYNEIMVQVKKAIKEKDLDKLKSLLTDINKNK